MSTDTLRLEKTSTEAYFTPFRKNIIGIDQTVTTPFGTKKIIYTDWTASGRQYRPIEELFLNEIYPFVANTHTETNVTGHLMTMAYKKARQVIKDHVGATKKDILISSNSGMTGVANKFQRILGLRIHEKFMDKLNLPEEERPVIFCTHMEHHSNQTSWLETIADLEIIPPTSEGLVKFDGLHEVLRKYKNRKHKFAAVTSCSNVTGIITPYHEIAQIMHENGGYCFVDFAASAPYIDINMHPEHPLQHLDAIYFSPHKFLGGPGSSGILIFNESLYHNRVPDNPGGGTVDWTNPWGEHRYSEEIEAREDGGTPSFLQTMRATKAIQLKEQMGVANMLRREHELLEIIWKKMDKIPNLYILADQHRKNRLGIISFYIKDLHYNLAVKLLNDLYGIQTRGGCSCAGTYGHYLLGVSTEYSHEITERINIGDLSAKPGWVRLSIHPTMTNDEMNFVMNAIEEVASNFKQWENEYRYNPHTNEFMHINEPGFEQAKVAEWF